MKRRRSDADTLISALTKENQALLKLVEVQRHGLDMYAHVVKLMNRETA